MDKPLITPLKTRSMLDSNLTHMIVNPDGNWMMHSVLLGTFNSDEMYAGTVNFDSDRCSPFKGRFPSEKSQNFIEKASFKPPKLAITTTGFKESFSGGKARIPPRLRVEELSFIFSFKTSER